MKIVFEDLFEQANWQPIVYQGKKLIRADKIHLPAEKTSIRVTFIKTDSKWKQGIALRPLKGRVEVEGELYPKGKLSRLWEHAAPKVINVTVHAKDKILWVYNLWETEDKTVHFWHNGAAMYVEEHEGYKIYYCNDGWPDDDLNDLIFKLEILPVQEEEPSPKKSRAKRKPLKE